MTDKLWKSFERWVGANVFDGAKRNIGSGAVNRDDKGNPRSGDLIHDLYQIECKCHSKISIFRWWDKLKEEAKASGKIPCLVMREKGDKKDVLVAIHYTTFVEMRKAWERERNGQKRD